MIHLHPIILTLHQIQTQWIPDAIHDCSTTVSLNAFFSVWTPIVEVEEFGHTFVEPVCCRGGFCILGAIEPLLVKFVLILYCLLLFGFLYLRRIGTIIDH